MMEIVACYAIGISFVAVVVAITVLGWRWSMRRAMAFVDA